MSPHPLIEVQFWRAGGDGTKADKTSFWYHVPRVGDFVLIGEGETEYRGQVKSVTWLDLDEVVVVWLG